MDSATIAEVNRAALLWKGIMETFRIDGFLTPVNLAAEREAVVENWRLGRRYDPQFTYEPPSSQLIAGLYFSAAEMDKSPPFSASLAANLIHNASLLSALKFQRSELVTQLTVAEYGHPSQDLVTRAWKILEQAPRSEGDDGKIVDADEIATALRASLERGLLPQWIVVVEPHMSARVSVSAITHTVKVREDATFQAGEVARMIVHELGTHVARAANGARQRLEVLAVGLPGYLETEEGLAAYHEELFSVADASSMRRYALRAIAVSKSLEASFWETFCLLADYTDPYDAFSIVQRVRRGIFDSVAPGSYVKDFVYLAGVLNVRACLDENPANYRLLMMGKVGLGDLSVISDLDQDGLMREPTFGPRVFI